jgi:hypothetical protein
MRIKLLLFILTCSFSFAQVTTIISPSIENGGFEQGIAGWEIQSNSGVNKWAMGNVPTLGYNGNSCAFVSNSSSFPLNHQYTPSSVSISKLYKTVTIPAYTQNFVLSFKILRGNTSNSSLSVYLLPESTVLDPNNSNYGTSLATYSNSSANWEEKSIQINNSLLGNTTSSSIRKIVFIWTNGSSSGTSNILPSAIDDIKIDTCHSPLNLTSVANPISLNLNWESNDTSWVLRYKKNNETQWTEVNVNSKPFLLNNLINSTQYNIQVKNSNLYCNTWSIVNNFTTSSVNDNCENALVLTNEDINSNVTNLGEFQGSTLSNLPLQCQANSNLVDLWYKFTADATRYIYSGNNYGSVEIYQSNNCSNLSFISCSQDSTTYINNLQIGTIYYLRIISSNTSTNLTFRFVKSPEPPINDNCINAITLQPGVNSQSNLAGSTFESVVPPINFVLGDIWFKFTATANYYTVNCSPAKVSIFKGSDCNNLQYVQYLGEFDQYSGGQSKNTNILEIGETYYLRVYFENVTRPKPVTIRVQTISSPINDQCNGAINIPLDVDGETQYTISSTQFATPSTGITTTCTSYTNKDIWYKFTPTVNKYIITSSWNITIYSGTCNVLSQVNCGTNFVLNDLIIGQEYYIRAFDGQTITIREFSAEDECITATQLFPSLSPPYVYSTTQNATPSVGSTIKDVWFKFTASSIKHRIDILNNSSYVPESVTLNIYSGVCNTLNEITPISTSVFDGTVFSNLSIGQTYNIRVKRNINTYFGIRVVHINTQPNDLIENAITLIPDNQDQCNLINGSTEGAEPSVSLNNTLCNVNQNTNKDVWYSFIATEQKYKIVFNSNAWHVLNIFKEISPNSIQIFTCNKGNLSGFEIGVKYFIRISKNINTDNEAQNFSFCISKIINSPANDECINATEVIPSPDLNCINNISGNLTNSCYNIQNPIQSSCTGGYIDDLKDIWYKFTAISNKMLITNNSTNTNHSFSYRLFENNCTNYVCTNNTDNIYGGSKKILQNLTIGNQYLIRITMFENAQSNPEINFCLSNAPTITNDLCENPITITTSSNLECTETITNYLGIASPSISLNVSGCGSNFNPYIFLTGNYVNYNDRWYQFVATNTEHFLDFLTGNLEFNGDFEAIQLFKGNCNGYICQSTTNYIQSNGVLFNNLIIGETYTIRIIEKQTNNLRTYSFCLKTPLPSPVNNYPQNAIQLNASPNLRICNSTSYLFNRASYNSNIPYPSSVIMINENPDLWYKFVATSPHHQLLIYNNNPDIVGFEYYKTLLYGSSNGNISNHITSFNPFEIIMGIGNSGVQFNNNGYYYLTYQNYYNLTVGETYFIRLIGGNDNYTNPYNFRKSMTFELCLKTLPEEPINKTINTATTINVSNNQNLQYITGYTTRNSYVGPSLINFNTSPCAELPAIYIPYNSASNVWYKFTATETAHKLNVINNADVLYPMSNFININKYKLVATLYEKINNIQTLKQCTLDTENEVIFSNLTIGNEYFIKMIYDKVPYIMDFEFQIAVSNLSNLSTDNIEFKDEIIIYPNPVKDILHFKTEKDIFKLEILDLTGRLLSSDSISENKIDLSELIKGNYILKIYTENGIMNYKIIKE